MCENKCLNASILGDLSRVCGVTVIGRQRGLVQVPFFLRVLLPDELLVLVWHAVLVDRGGVTILNEDVCIGGELGERRDLSCVAREDERRTGFVFGKPIRVRLNGVCRVLAIHLATEALCHEFGFDVRDAIGRIDVFAVLDVFRVDVV